MRSVKCHVSRVIRTLVFPTVPNLALIIDILSHKKECMVRRASSSVGQTGVGRTTIELSYAGWFCVREREKTEESKKERSKHRNLQVKQEQEEGKEESNRNKAKRNEKEKIIMQFSFFNIPTNPQ